MPRTKVSKNPKRNRDAAIREEKIREFDSTVDQFMNGFETKVKQNILEIETEIVLMKARIPEKILLMKMGDLMNMNASSFSEVLVIPTETQSSIQNQSSLLRSMKKSNDEGYLTEDSTNSMACGSQANLSIMHSVRAPGPLSSAKARRTRRSQSATGYPPSALKPKPSTTTMKERLSRQKHRTPLVSRQKAISADRTPPNRGKNCPGSPTALLRWPKPGEMVISMTGTPVVSSHVMPEQFANVNIPIRDGVLSLRPKKLSNLDPEIVHKIDQDTISQIKLLQSNLELIMSLADKSDA
ncbi:borealin-like [Episyrphus balteatus]|uniref:borealin-like n=1 Tax=Episyrphus balteatus TaxID=286459 RepID=UPI0024855DD6|nr:borealin-like [Episyrphus balteatus]XP_055857320.1 borealin-like [Episyrphus balteatus]